MSNDNDREHGPLDDFGSTGEWTNEHYEAIGGDSWDHDDKDRSMGGVAWIVTESYRTEEGAFFRATDLIKKQESDKVEHISNEVWYSREDKNAGKKAELGKIYPIYRLGNSWFLDYRVFVEGGTGDS